MTKLVLPHHRLSPINFFLEECNPNVVKGIKLDKSAYYRMRKDRYLRIVSSDDNEEVWVGDEILINGVPHPTLLFQLYKRDDGYIVNLIITYEIKYTFSEDYDVLISYE